MSKMNRLKLVDAPEDADIIIVNTCGVYQRFIDASVSLIGDLSVKKQPHARLVVYGCLMKIAGQSLGGVGSNVVAIDSFDQLVAFLSKNGSKEYETGRYLTNMNPARFAADHSGKDPVAKRICIHLAQWLCRMERRFNYPHAADAKIPMIINELNHSNKFFIEIASGCSHSCSYCGTKLARGFTKSRSISKIMEDLENIQSHVQRNGELPLIISLVGDDVGSFGVDTGESLIDLLLAINTRFPGYPIDMGSVYPGWLVDNRSAFLEILNKTFIHSINVPLQSGSPDLLRIMNRSYDPGSVIKVVREIKQISPETFIWGHFMVGHPGETWNDFWKTFDIFRQIEYASIFHFTCHNGTISATMQQKVNRVTMISRVMLLALQQASRMLCQLSLSRQ